MNDRNRREFLKASLAAGAALPFVAGSPAKATAANIIRPPAVGFSLYGMKNLPLDEALKTCAEIGYDGVELSLLPGYATEPTALSKADRKRLDENRHGLEFCGLMENLSAVTSDADHKKNLDRIARAAELAHDVNAVKIVETTLGGKPADWPAIRGPMTDRLRDWAETAKKHDIFIAIKPHVSGAVYRPEACKQLLDDVGSTSLWAVYDYSHYLVQGLKFEETLEVLKNHVIFVHVKDGRRVDGKVQFLLPGDGDTKVADLFPVVMAPFGQPCWITVEVSAQIFNRPDYDPHAAAKRSFAALMAAVKAQDSSPVKKP